jgi:hypothetical protein
MIKELNEFANSKYRELENILKTKANFSDEDLESYLYALIDISESISEIYSEIIPSILENKDIDSEKLDDLLVEIQANFKHIQYHIEDGKLSGD